MSFRTERSVVKNLGCIHFRLRYVTEILHYVQDDKIEKTPWNSVYSVVSKTTIMEIDYKKLEEFGITNEDPKWDNDNWLAKKIEKKTVQGKLDI